MSAPRDAAADIAVLIVDDHGMVRAGLQMIIDHEPGMRVVGEASDGLQAVTASRMLRPDVVLMDVRMPRQDGITSTRQITAEPEPRPAVLVLTTFDDEEYVLGAVRAGASGFLLKDAGPDALVSAVRTVHRGDSLVDPQVTRTLIARCLELEDRGTPNPSAQEWSGPLGRLSERERVVLRAMARGLSNRELAEHLQVSEATVKSHVSSVLSKLDLDSRVQAVVLAYELGVVRPGHVGPGQPA